MSFNLTEKIGLIEKLSAAFGPSGCEDLVADIITEELSGTKADVRRDPLGSVIAHIKGKSAEKRILLSCGMDECSFMVNSVDDSGFIKFEPLTKTDPRALPGRRVMVGDASVQVVGVVCSKPIHLQKGDDRKTAPDPDKHAIDIGCTDKESAEKIATVGSYVVNHGEFAHLGSDCIMGKALDSRVACAILIEEA
ncbi:MAG: M42 family peptidase, partial [Oscillospiraceae bacterium]|nr:M42 family peptidase [Oscillospiraceae bacterium]